MIILAFSIGMLFGLKKRLNFLTRFKILPILTCILLFSMGTEIGTSEEIFSNLTGIGFHAFLIALFATAGSFIATFIYTRLFSKTEEDERVD